MSTGILFVSQIIPGKLLELSYKKLFWKKEKSCLVVKKLQFSSVHLFSRVRLFATPWTVAHQASLSIANSELTQTHVHYVSDIQPSHPLSSPSPPALNLSQHQSLFQWVSSLHQVAKVLEFQLHHQSFQWIFGTDFLQ